MKKRYIVQYIEMEFSSSQPRLLIRFFSPNVLHLNKHTFWILIEVHFVYHFDYFEMKQILLARQMLLNS